MFKTLALCAILVSYMVTILVLPKWISRAKNHGLTGKDIHKKKKTDVAEAGGIVVILASAIALLVYIAVLVFFYNEKGSVINILAALCSLFLALIIGFVDDILGWRIGLRQRDKILLSFLIPLPIMVVNAGHHAMNLPFFGEVSFGLLYPLLIVPVAIIGSANAFNMLAGYNGLETGMGIIILSSLGIKLWTTGEGTASIIALCVCSGLIAFFGYNFYPAKVFPGDTMTYPVGAGIAIVAILGNIERFALYIFPLYFIELLLKLRGKFRPDWTCRLKSDNTLSNKGNINTVPHIAIVILKKLKIKPTERAVVLSILLVQVAITVLACLMY
ncbi:MAG: MraY family glycosyltransferase [Nanobdellota archaeon]